MARPGTESNMAAAPSATEHADGTHDENILALIDGADPFICDATYTAAEYDAHRGWGHSIWQEGAALVREAQDVFTNTVVARDGLTLSA